MGYISKLAARRKEVFPGRERAAITWQQVFGQGATTKETPHPQSQKPVPGGTFGRSIANSGPAIKRLVQAFRSMAPGGWSLLFLFGFWVVSTWLGDSVFYVPTMSQPVIDYAYDNAELLCPLGVGFCFSVDSSGFAVPVSPKWNCQCFFNWPSSFNSVFNHTDRSTKPFCPLGHTESFPVVGQENIPPSVSLLLRTGRPSAVVFGIVSVVVGSVDGVFVFGNRLRSHVHHEFAETVIPPFANANPSAPIVGVSVVVLFAAPIPHSSPRPEFRAIEPSESAVWHREDLDHDVEPLRCG